MFDLDTRKRNTKLILTTSKNILYKINPNHAVNGLIVLLFHWCSVGIPLLGLFIFNLDWKFYTAAIMWIVVLLLHLYFNGCIFTRLERELWNTKDWYGPWFLPFNVLEYLNVPITSGLANNIYVCWGIAITIWIIIRIVFNNN